MKDKLKKRLEVLEANAPKAKDHILYKLGFEDAIDKACDWLYEFNRKQANKMFGTVHTADVTINVAEFRKAMKGGEE